MNDFSNARSTTDTADEEREPAPQETRADPAPDPAGGFRVTWARAANGARIGKIKTPSGKWPPTLGAKSTRYFYEVREYANLEEYRVDYEARMKDGRFARIAGAPRPELDLTKPHRRIGQNFVDTASTCLGVDFDGLEPDDVNAPIDSPGAYSDAEGAFFVALRRLPKAFIPAKCMVSATSSTGQKLVSTGAPSEGKARFRVTWELTRALTCKQKGKLAKTLKALPGVACIDDEFYSLAHFEFVPRPVFLEGENDPITEPVYALPGGLLDVDAVCAELGIDLDTEGATAKGARKKRSAGSGAPFSAPPAAAYALADSVVNGPWFDSREHWIGYAHTMRNVFGRDLGWVKFQEFNNRRIGADGKPVANDPDEDREAYDGLRNSQNDIWDLAGYARQHGGEAGRTAYYDFVFPDLTPEEEAENERAEKEAGKTGWDHFEEALRWPGQEKALKLSSGVARNKFGAAMIGKGASTTPSMARQWVTDRHARGHVSMLSGLPACGKTELDVAYAHAMATERPDLVGLSEMDLYGAVVFLALDSERAEEFKMRGEAFRKYHGLQPSDFKHEIYVIDDCGPLVERQSDKTFEPSRGIIRVAKFLGECRECENLSIVVVDTVLGAAGGADTADPSTTGAIMRVSKEIGILLNCSTDLINHHTKGGALRNPDGMDAALGTRDASATTRFMTNLKKEGNYVRVVQAKQSYHGPKGCFLYEFKSVDIVSVRPEDPTRTVVQSIGVLVPAAKSAAAGAFAAEDAHQALWDAHDTRKIKIKRKSGKTAKGKDYASVIIEDAGAVDYASPGGRRAEAERLLDLLIKDKRIEVVEEWVNRNQVEFIVPKEPEELV